MTVSEREGPQLRTLDGACSRILSYRPFEPVLERADGIYLYDTDGNRYIDASSGPCAANLGHGDKRVGEAIAKQLAKFAYCHPALSSQPRADLSERIAQVAPGSMNTSHLCSGGSEAVEGAIKFARQYHVERGNTQKHMIISRHESYHGATLGAMSATGDARKWGKFAPLRQQWPKIRQPSDLRCPPGMTFEDHALQCARELEEAIHYAGPDNVAAFIATPVGGAASDYALMPPPEYWQTIRDICDRYDVLLIADEVVTGYGRTGRWFGMEHFGVQADIMATAKGISGVYAPLGAITLTDEVSEPFRTGDAVFGHGFTNGGHPLSCAAGIAVIDAMEEDGLVENSASVGAYLHSQKDRFLDHPTVMHVRGTGLLMSLELVADKETGTFFPPETDAEMRLQSIGLKNGMALFATLYGPQRPEGLERGHSVTIAPPLCITHDQVDELTDVLDRTLTQWEEVLGVA